MNIDDALIEMLRLLEKHNVYPSKQFMRDIKSLVKTDIKKFIKDFTKNFLRVNLKEHKKFERLGTTPSQNKRLNGNALFRYEYRNTSNLRCIYMVLNVNNINETHLLCAFNEDGNKHSGKNSYDLNIKRAIRIYEQK